MSLGVPFTFRKIRAQVQTQPPIKAIDKNVATVIVALDGTGDFDNIQAGIDSLYSTVGGVVYIKEGTYKISTKISINKANVALIGSGRSTVIESSTTTFAGPLIEITSNRARITNLFCKNGTTLEDIVAIYINSANECSIDSCWLEDVTDSTIQVAGDRNRIDSNYIESLNAGVFINAGDNNVVTGNVINNTLSSVGVLISNDSDYNVISSNRIMGTGSGDIGIRIQHSNCNSNQIHGNNLQACSTTINDSGTDTMKEDNVPDVSVYATISTLNNYATLATLNNYATRATLDNYATLKTLTNYYTIHSNSNVFNESGADVDFRVESDGEANMFFLDASTNRVGIGTATPTNTFHVYGDASSDVFLCMGYDATSGPAMNIGYAGASYGRGTGFFNTRPDASATGINPSLRFLTTNVLTLALTNAQNAKFGGGTAVRATTEGTNHVDIFNGTAPVGTLANGISLYSTSGELRVMDAAGNATLLSPHDKNNNWIFESHVGKGKDKKHIRVDMEKMVRFLNKHFGADWIHEIETP